MSLLKVLSTLGDVLASPANVIASWAEEPLKRSEHKRTEESKDKDVHRDIQRQVGVETALSDQRMKEQEHLSSLSLKEQAHQTDMQIRRETEVNKELSNQRIKEKEHETEIARIYMELEHIKQDKELEQKKAITDAIMQYQQALMKINTDAMSTIANMGLEVTNKAHDMIAEKTRQYKELQDEAIHQSMEQLEKIDSNQAMSDASKMIMQRVVETKVVAIISNAEKFIEQLNEDIKRISNNVDLLTSNGQSFIQQHLEKFQLIGMSGETTALLESSSEKLVGFEK
ncbi:MAG: hypothetical protein WCJ11_07160 [Methylococcaceae bacterium]